VSSVRYELGFYIPENGILHSHRRENLKSYKHLSTLLLCKICGFHGGDYEVWRLLGCYAVCCISS
jgi:hypothetical protein